MQHQQTAANGTTDRGVSLPTDAQQAQFLERHGVPHGLLHLYLKLQCFPERKSLGEYCKQIDIRQLHHPLGKTISINLAKLLLVCAAIKDQVTGDTACWCCLPLPAVLLGSRWIGNRYMHDN